MGVMSLPPTASPPAADALEQRDTWRDAWQVLTSDAILVILCLLAGLALAARLFLPQQPAGGTSDPLAYSQWQAQAHVQTGAGYDTTLALGLFDVNGAPWLHVVLAILCAVVLLRLVDRLAHLFHRPCSDTLRDEGRVRVTEQAPAQPDAAMWLRAHRYRVSVPAGQTTPGAPDWLAADRQPWAELFSCVLHAGLLIAVAGALVNIILGWGVTRQQIGAGQKSGTDAAITTLHDHVSLQLAAVEDAMQKATLRVQGGLQPVTLSEGQATVIPWVRGLSMPYGLTLRLDEITPGYRIRANNASGQPLTITVSSYAEPSQEVLLAFRRDEPERLVAVEAADLAVLVSADAGGHVQVYGVPSGNLITDTPIRPSVVVSGTTLLFTPASSVAVDAQYDPGDALLVIGACLAFVGLIATMLWPMQRLIVRHHGHWTEVYASGRGVRRVVREMLAVATPVAQTSPPDSTSLGQASVASVTTSEPAEGGISVSTVLLKKEEGQDAGHGH